MDKTTSSDTQIDMYLYVDKSRGTEPYSFINDLNGGYVIENREGNNDFIESDYVNVHFFLELEKESEDEIFIGGKLTDWRYDASNRMEYNKISGLYMCNLMLKQGLYDFGYFTPGNADNPSILEGNHFETKNEYEIIVYFRDQKINTDVIIGYLKFM